MNIVKMDNEEIFLHFIGNYQKPLRVSYLRARLFEGAKWQPKAGPSPVYWLLRICLHRFHQWENPKQHSQCQQFHQASFL